MSTLWKLPERIRFVRVIGEGGFGRVYLANVHWAGFTQTLAVKYLHGASEEQAEALARHRDEARMLGQLNHDHIVKVFNQFEYQGRPAVLMESVDGVDARMILAREPFPVRAALQTVAAVADALDHAWNAPKPGTDEPMRVVHRDIKPGNILISRSGVPKVVDFGAAQADMDRSAVTRVVDIKGRTLYDQVGTTRFMAPERFRGERPEPAVDIFALGMVLVLMLTRAQLQRAPQQKEEHHRYVRDLLYVVEQTCPEGRYLAPLLSLLSRMLAFHPDLRPTADEVRNTARTLADHAPGESLMRFAGRVVPDLLEEKKTQFATAKLPHDVVFPESDLSEPTLRVHGAPVGSSARHRAIPMSALLGILGLAVAALLTSSEVSGRLIGPMPRVTKSAPARPPAPVAQPAAIQEPAEEPAPEATPPAPDPARPTPQAPLRTAAIVDPAPRPAASVCPREGAGPGEGPHPLLITTTAGSAEIVLAGQTVGQTPKLLSLPAGRYPLCLELDGAPHRFTLTVASNQPDRLTLDPGTGAWALSTRE
ncbi:MAG: serine/threonine protein kinase [Alphaproteobacteria bacterium]|nr:serine/threonine protein kinase [Alphaproteobacteria bacterium]